MYIFDPERVHRAVTHQENGMGSEHAKAFYDDFVADFGGSFARLLLFRSGTNF